MRDIIIVSHRRRVLFTKEICISRGALPKWKPHIHVEDIDDSEDETETPAPTPDAESQAEAVQPSEVK